MSEVVERPVKPARYGSRRLWWALAAGSVSFVAFAAVTALVLTGETRSTIPIVRTTEGDVEDAARLHRRSTARIESYAPRGVWVSVDSTGGRIRVHRAGEILRDAACSAGSGVSLRDPRNGKVWTFRTPTGERSVIRKVKDPVWVKPDWAFVEEGFEPPPLGARDRRDDFSLGAYALHLGDGYMIHGTVFQSLVGRPVTHGCIRLRDEDLEYVYRTVPLGTRVFLY